MCSFCCRVVKWKLRACRATEKLSQRQSARRRQDDDKTYVVHDSGPALHGDALKDGEHGEEDAVEADDAELGSLPAGRADRLAGRTDEAAAAEAAAAAVAPAVGRARRELRLARQVPVV